VGRPEPNPADRPEPNRSGRPEDAGGAGIERDLDKDFHVSPFMGMDSRYAFRFESPGDVLRLSIDCRRRGASFFHARLQLARHPWSDRELARHALRHFARPLRLHAAIYWQALRLFAAGVRFQPHPGLAPEELDSTASADTVKEASAS
jgi:DUF1365 family protein